MDTAIVIPSRYGRSGSMASRVNWSPEKHLFGGSGVQRRPLTASILILGRERLALQEFYNSVTQP